MKFTLKAVSDIMNRRPRLCIALLLITGIMFMITWGKLKSSVTFHIDELWQYSFSNSYGKLTNVVETADHDKWLPASVFRDYISVQPGEEYSFRKITQATSRDIHPPLSHYALNFASSLAPNTFSKWFGLGVNIFCYALTIAALYYLALTVFASRQKALIATALWAFSLGAVNTVMYIRMYCMLTLFTVSVAAFTIRYMKTGSYRALILAYASFILGGLTDYIFWIFGFFLTLAFIIVRLRQNFRQAITFAAVALAAFLSTCALFPTTYQQFMNSNSLSRRATNNFGVLDKLNKSFDLQYVLNRFLTYASDQSFFVPANLTFILLCILTILALALPLVIAFFSVLSYSIKQDARESAPQSPAQINKTICSNISLILTQTVQVYIDSLKSFLCRILRLPSRHPLGCCLLITVVFSTYTIAAVFPDFDIWTGRAFFFLYPFFALSLAFILFTLHEKGKVSVVILTVITCGLLIRELTLVRPPFLFRGGYEKLVNKLKDANVIFVLDSTQSSSRLASFSPALSKAKNVYFTVIKDERYRQQMEIAIATAEKSGPVMIINTIGTPMENDSARSVIGDELLLTNDTQLVDGLKQQGSKINVVKRGAQLFQWFNLYQVAPTPRPDASGAATNIATTPPPAMPAPE